MVIITISIIIIILILIMIILIIILFSYRLEGKIGPPSTRCSARQRPSGHAGRLDTELDGLGFRVLGF